MHDASAAPLYPQPALDRLAMSRPRRAASAGVSAPASAPGNPSQTVPPHLRPAVGRSAKQTIGVAQSHDNSGSVVANPSQMIPPHLRRPIGHAPQQLDGCPRSVPPHLRAPTGSSTRQPASTDGSGEGPNFGAKSQTGDTQAPGNTRALANALGGLQKSPFTHDTQATHSTPPTQTAALKGTETAKRVFSADSNESLPVNGQSTDRKIRLSAQNKLPPHLRQSARGPAQQSSGADAAGGAQGGSAIFNFYTGGTEANAVFNFQAGNSQSTTGRPRELQYSSQLAKGAQPPTSSSSEAIAIPAPRANNATNASNHAPVDHLPSATSSQPVRGHGGLKDSRFASNGQLGQSTPLPATLLTTPNTANNSYGHHFGGAGSGVKSQDAQKHHIAKYATLTAAAKEVPAFVPAATKPVMAPSTTRPGLITPEPDNKGDSLSGDVEMVDAERDPVVDNATKHTHGGVLQSRWASRAIQATKATEALEADVLGYRVSLSNATPKSAETNNFQAS